MARGSPLPKSEATSQNKGRAANWGYDWAAHGTWDTIYGTEVATYGSWDTSCVSRDTTYVVENITYGTENITYGAENTTYGAEDTAHGTENINYGTEKRCFVIPAFRAPGQLTGCGAAGIAQRSNKIVKMKIDNIHKSCRIQA